MLHCTHCRIRLSILCAETIINQFAQVFVAVCRPPEQQQDNNVVALVELPHVGICTCMF